MNDTGGAAFARPASIDPEYDARVPSQEGMTLRDYFAAKAMQGFISNTDLVHMYNPENMAKWAYERADAMLKAREA
jgi:hypothetical protein